MPALLHDPAIRDAIRARLQTLRPDAPRKFGKMTVDQMLWHVNQALAQADTVDEALHSATEILRVVWQARRVLAVTFPTQPTAVDEPDVLCIGDQTNRISAAQ